MIWISIVLFWCFQEEIVSEDFFKTPYGFILSSDFAPHLATKTLIEMVDLEAVFNKKRGSFQSHFATLFGDRAERARTACD